MQGGLTVEEGMMMPTTKLTNVLFGSIDNGDGDCNGDRDGNSDSDSNGVGDGNGDGDCDSSGTFCLDKSVPTTTLPPLAPRSTRLLRRNHSTLIKYNLLSSITTHRPPSSNRAWQYRQNHLPTSG